VETLDVLPALGQQGDEEVDRLGQVASELFNAESINAEALSEPRELLDSESDGSHHFLDLLLDVLSLADGHGELTNRGDVSTNALGDILVDGFGDEEEIELTSPLLDQLGFVVELLQIVLIDSFDAESLSLLEVLHSADDADLKVRAAVRVKSGRGVETLFLFGVIVAEHDLELQGFHELALLSVRQSVFD